MKKSRCVFLEGVSRSSSNVGEEVLRVGSNETGSPVVDSEGEERWLVWLSKVPTGSRDGDAYDGGYAMKRTMRWTGKRRQRQKEICQESR